MNGNGKLPMTNQSQKKQQVFVIWPTDQHPDEQGRRRRGASTDDGANTLVVFE